MPHARTHHLPPLLQKLLAPLLSQEPAAQLIRSTARQQWRLLAVNLGSSVLEALSEGATLDWLPPEPPGSPARTNPEAAARRRAPGTKSPRTTCSPTPQAP